jgi:hypothetical protein
MREPLVGMPAPMAATRSASLMWRNWMSVLSYVGHFFRDVGRDIQYRFEGAVMDFSDFGRFAQGTQGEAACDDVPDLPSSMASFERMLRLLEEKRAWPEESLRLEDDEDFDNWRDWPMSLCGGTMASPAML